MRMKRSVDIASVLMNIIVVLLIVDRSEGVPRNQIVQQSCNNETENNPIEFSSNFIQTMERIGAQMQTSLNGTASAGTAPNRNYGLLQCYGDLSTTDCILCYDTAHYVVSRCFPSTGARVYFDGCFIRFQNYSFYEEYSGTNDTAICGNTTTRNNVFQDSVARAVSNAARDASTNGGFFAREQVTVSGTVNESAYVLANCWSTLNASSCRTCLEAASVSILKCLPWSEGRALNTGCFMRYSDTDFLNPMAVRRRNRGNNELFFPN